MSLERFMASAESLGPREIGVIASTNELARDGHIVEPSGINLEGFRRCPIVLFNHQSEHPVGACSAIGIEDGVLAARIEFAPEGASFKADEVCALAKAGVLRGVSIGFDPLEIEPLDPRAPFGGQHILKSDLIEISMVGAPADTGARVVARSFTERQRRAIRALVPIRRSAVAAALGALALTREQQVPPGLRSPRQWLEDATARSNAVWAKQEASRRERGAPSMEERRRRVEELQAIDEARDRTRQ